MERQPVEDPLLEANRLRLRLGLTTAFWVPTTGIVAAGSVYVVNVAGARFALPGVFLTFTVAIGAAFWIREVALAYRDAREALGR